MENNKYILTILFALSLLVNIVFCFSLKLSFFETDSYGYIETAKVYLRIKHLYSFWPSGYPLFIAFIFRIFGENISALILLNCILGALSVCLVYLIASIVICEVNSISACNNIELHKFFSYIPLCASLFTVLHPHILNYIRLALSETLAASLLLFSIYYALRSRFFLSGIFWGLCLIVRPSALFITLFIAACCFVPLFSWRLLFRNQLLFFIGIAFVLIPISINTTRNAGRFRLISDSGAINIIQAIGNDKSGITPSFKIDVSPRLFYNYLILNPGKMPMEVDETPIHYYVRFACNYPMSYIRQRLKACYDFFGIWPVGESRNLLRKLFFVSFRIPTYIFSIIAVLWMIRKSYWRFFLSLFGPVFGLALMHTMLHSETRHIVFVEPILMILTAIGLIKTAHFLHER